MATLFPETITTDRLRLERLSLDTVDLGSYYECCSAHEPDIDTVTEYLPWTPHASVHETKTVIENYERQWDEGTRAEYVIRPRSDAATIAGSAGLLCRWEQDLALPAIWLRKRFWGRGYSGKRADALLELAFERLDFGVVAIVLHRENDRSFAAVERYVDRHDGRYEGHLRHHAGRYDEPADHHRFSISQDEYQSARGTGDAYSST